MSMCRLEANGFVVEVLPDLGAGLARLDWTTPDGPSLALFRQASETAVQARFHSGLAMFLMAPFANRIDGGTFAFAGRRIVLPITNPAERTAVHGLSRDRPWRVTGTGRDRIALEQVVDEPAIGYHYRAGFSLELDERSVRMALTLINMVAAPLPHGLGFHPWFPMRRGASVAFHATHQLDADVRHLPCRAHKVRGRLGSGDAARLDEQVPFDIHFAVWSGEAMIEWPHDGLRLSLSSSPALRNLHVYMPASREVFCVEPVSHVPDVVNRRAFARLGDMSVLAPGEGMEGAVVLSPAQLTPARQRQPR